MSLIKDELKRRVKIPYSSKDSLRLLYEYAKIAYQKGNTFFAAERWEECYISWYGFLQVATSLIPANEDFKYPKLQYDIDKKELKTSLEDVELRIEYVVVKIDTKIRALENLDLEAEFDEMENSVIGSQRDKLINSLKIERISVPRNPTNQLLEISAKNWFIPNPVSELYELNFTSQKFLFSKDDFGISFKKFYRDQSQIQGFSELNEINRCFFVHIGVAYNIHPYIVQWAFRKRIEQLVNGEKADDSLACLILDSVMEVGGLVDANMLLFAWPKEFYHSRICFICEGSSIVISSFEHIEDGTRASREIIILYRRDHFCLLRPFATEVDRQNGSFLFLDNFLADAKSKGYHVDTHQIVNPSIWSIANFQ